MQPIDWKYLAELHLSDFRAQLLKESDNSWAILFKILGGRAPIAPIESTPMLTVNSERANP